MTFFGIKLNRQFVMLILLILGYSIFCSYGFILDLQKNLEFKNCQQSHVEILQYFEKTEESVYFLVAEWVLGIASSILALILIFKGQKFLMRESEQNVKIKLLTNHINQLNDPKQSVDQFYAQMQTQFGQWGLAKSESDIALLLLKGLSFKEMAKIRGSSEKAIRQQASTIYSKSDLKGRNEFSAFFFEALLMGNGDNTLTKISAER